MVMSVLAESDAPEHKPAATRDMELLSSLLTFSSSALPARRTKPFSAMIFMAYLTGICDRRFADPLHFFIGLGVLLILLARSLRIGFVASTTLQRVAPAGNLLKSFPIAAAGRGRRIERKDIKLVVNRICKLKSRAAATTLATPRANRYPYMVLAWMFRSS